jgi:hypothetical protein
MGQTFQQQQHLHQHQHHQQQSICKLALETFDEESIFTHPGTLLLLWSVLFEENSFSL